MRVSTLHNGMGHRCTHQPVKLELELELEHESSG